MSIVTITSSHQLVQKKNTMPLAGEGIALLSPNLTYQDKNNPCLTATLPWMT
ncbi:hypothetical protein NJ959_02025 [Symplocastrum sp. BBK-W-15]|uniref:Uncharacterized protein n=1 Tax=Limnofasciculus baicalensis BBK-W-15 TaxID=2699891 RepID=A0AAE3GMC8_9CYAN|nr:hypothetical protein [Limnofasciculus baicalensis BBK-W-15]